MSPIKAGALVLSNHLTTTEAFWPFAPSPTPPPPSYLGVFKEQIQGVYEGVQSWFEETKEKEENSSLLGNLRYYTKRTSELVTEHPTTAALTATAIAAAVTGHVLYNEKSVEEQLLDEWIKSAPQESRADYKTAKQRILTFLKTPSQDSINLGDLRLASLPSIFSNGQIFSRLRYLHIKSGEDLVPPSQITEQLNQCISLSGQVLYTCNQTTEQLLDLWVRFSPQENRANHEIVKERIDTFLGSRYQIALDLDGLNLETLPPIFSDQRFLTRLNQLYLAHNQLSELPPEIGAFSRLKALHIDSNHIQSLPAELLERLNQCIPLSDRALYTCNQTTEQLLDLWVRFSPQENRINHMTAKQIILNFLNSPSQASLNLNQLDLKTLPPVFSNERFRTRLQYLYLAHNQLREFPPHFEGLSKLETLFIDNNEIEVLPPEIEQLLTLRMLNVNMNPFVNTSNKLIYNLSLHRGIGFAVGSTPLLPFPRIRCLHTWARTASSDELEKWTHALSPAHKTNLTAWLERLFNIRDFQIAEGTPKKERLARSIISFFERAAHDPAYSEKLLNVVTSTGTTCGDGMAVSVIDLHLLDLEVKGKDLSDSQKVLSYLKNEWMIEVIRQVAIRKIASLPPDFAEPLEVRLAYLVHLKEKLQLNLPIDSMLFQTYSATTPLDIQKALRIVDLLRQGQLEKVEKFLPMAQEHARGWAKTFTEKDTFTGFLLHGGEASQPHPTLLAHLKTSPYAEELQAAQETFEEGIDRVRDEDEAKDAFEKVQSEYNKALLKIINKNLFQNSPASADDAGSGGAGGAK